MLYNEEKNIDYINMNLKRIATEDEIHVLNSLWKEMLPYRYLKSYYKKRFSNNIFSEKIFKNVKINNYRVIVKPSLRIYENDNITLHGDCLKTVTALGTRPDALGILTTNDNQNDLNQLAKYYNDAGVPIINTLYDTKNGENHNPDIYNIKRDDIFCLSLEKNRKIKKQKIKSGMNIVIVGDETVTNGSTNTNSFMQKKLIEACLEITQKDISSASKTCNEGLFSAIIKMIKNGGYGIYINIDNLHKSTQHAHAWESLVAHTPERLIFAIKDWKLVDFINIVDKYEIPFSIIGKIDKSSTVKVVHKGNLAINLPKKLILNPINKVNNSDFEKYSCTKSRNEIEISSKIDKILNNEIFVSSHNKFTTFDSLIGNKTSLFKTESGTAELWYPKINHYVSTALHTMHLQFDFEPYTAGENLVSEAVRKIVAMGHEPIAISIICSLNFSKQGEVSRFEESRRGIFHAVNKLDIKLLNLDVTNNDKFSSVSVFAIGKNKRSNKILVPYFHNEQNVYLIGKVQNPTSTSLYQSLISTNVYPIPDKTDYKFEKKLYKCIKKLRKNNLITSCIAPDRFGIFGAIHKALRANKLGIDLNISDYEYLLNEIQSRFLISSNTDIETFLNKLKVPYKKLGVTNKTGQVKF